MFSSNKIIMSAAGSGGVVGWISEFIQSGVTPNYGDSKATIDSSGNVVIAVEDVATYDLIVVKTDIDGNVLWSKKIDAGATPRITRVSSIITDSSDNIIIAGGYDQDGGSSAYRETGYLIKLNSSGVKQWSDNIRYASYGEWLSGVTVDGSGNIYVCATFADDANSSAYSGYVIKFNSSGAEQWKTRLYDTGDFNYLNGIYVDSSGNIYVAGHARGESGYTNYTRPTLIKLNSSGTKQWHLSYNAGISTNGYGFGVVVDGSGNIYINGLFIGNSWLAKYNTSGAEQWQKKVSGTTAYYGSIDSDHSNMTIDSSGNIYFTSRLNSSPISGNITSFDSSGNLRWSVDVKDASAAEAIILNGCYIDANDNLVLAGRRASGTAANRRFIAFKVPSDGAFTGTFGNYTFTDVGNSATSETYTLTTARLLFEGSLSSKSHTNPSETVSTPTITQTLTDI